MDKAMSVLLCIKKPKPVGHLGSTPKQWKPHTNIASQSKKEVSHNAKTLLTVVMSVLHTGHLDPMSATRWAQRSQKRVLPHHTEAKPSHGENCYKLILRYAVISACMLENDEDDDEIAYFTVRWKTRASFVYRTKNMR